MAERGAEYESIFLKSFRDNWGRYPTSMQQNQERRIAQGGREMSPIVMMNLHMMKGTFPDSLAIQQHDFVHHGIG